MKRFKKILMLMFLFCFGFICFFFNGVESVASENVNEVEELYKFSGLDNLGEVIYDKNKPIMVEGQKVNISKYYESNKEMFRGTWIATISNINFPKKQGETFEELVSEFNEILDRVQELNLNAIFFQVSPELDAFYESKFRPWSKYLTGEQGKEPEYKKEGKDFLSYAISETRRRGMEFHAWFNPYRVTKDAHLDKSKDEILNMLSEDNFARKNKHMVYLFGGKLYLDPGYKEVVEFIKNTIHEFIDTYNVDGIHFDDYFYPYGSQVVNGVSYKFGDRNEDAETFKNNSRGINDIKDWRRDNVNILVKEIHSLISHYNFTNKENIQWGISPFGIYAHKGDEYKDGIKTGNLPNGSNTPYGSLSSYRDIYADTLYWINNDLIDYVIPQIYWTFGKKEAPYEELVNFWNNAVEGKRCQLYIGHGNYGIRENTGEKSWSNPYEITNQIKFNSNFKNIKGSAFFSVNDLCKSSENVVGSRKKVYEKYITSLENDILKYKSLIPSKTWLDIKQTSDIYDLKVLNNEGKNYLFFKDKPENDSKFYVVYGFENEQQLNNKSNENILGVYGKQYMKELQSIILDNVNENIKILLISVKDNSGMETEGVKYILK